MLCTKENWLQKVSLFFILINVVFLISCVSTPIALPDASGDVFFKCPTGILNFLPLVGSTKSGVEFVPETAWFAALVYPNCGLIDLNKEDKYNIGKFKTVTIKKKLESVEYSFDSNGFIVAAKLVSPRLNGYSYYSLAENFNYKSKDGLSFTYDLTFENNHSFPRSITKSKVLCRFDELYRLVEVRTTFGLLDKYEYTINGNRLIITQNVYNREDNSKLAIMPFSYTFVFDPQGRVSKYSIQSSYNQDQFVYFYVDSNEIPAGYVKSGSTYEKYTDRWGSQQWKNNGYKNLVGINICKVDEIEAIKKEIIKSWEGDTITNPYVLLAYNSDGQISKQIRCYGDLLTELTDAQITMDYK